jgi:hypothetical protein
MTGALRHNLVLILSLVGVILVGLGALYLAYDLLGGKNGPLRTFTKSASYAVLFGSAYGLPLGLWFGLAGLLFSGPALSVEIGRRNVREVHPFLEALALGLLRAVSFGAAGWLAKDSWFGIIFGIFCAVGFVATYLIVGPPANIDLGHPRLDKAVLERAALRAASIGFAAVLSGAIHRENRTLSYGVEVGVVTGMSSGIMVAIAPSVEAWVDNLPERRLGGYGAILVLIGSLLQTPQYVFPLVGLPTM